MVLGAGRKITLSIGGQVASSLPTSLRRTTRELDNLKAKTSDERNELRSLSTQLRQTSKGTAEYERITQRVATLRDGLAGRGARIRELTIRQRGLNEQWGRFAQLGTFAVAGVGATIAAVGAFGSLIRSQAQGLRGRQGEAELAQLDVQELERVERFAQLASLNVDNLRQQVVALNRELQDPFVFGNLERAAASIGVDTAALAGAGALDQLRQLSQAYDAASEARQSLFRQQAADLVQLFPAFREGYESRAAGAAGATLLSPEAREVIFELDQGISAFSQLGADLLNAFANVTSTLDSTEVRLPRSIENVFNIQGSNANEIADEVARRQTEVLQDAQ